MKLTFPKSHDDCKKLEDDAVKASRLAEEKGDLRDAHLYIAIARAAHEASRTLIVFRRELDAVSGRLADVERDLATRHFNARVDAHGVLLGHGDARDLDQFCANYHAARVRLGELLTIANAGADP